MIIREVSNLTIRLQAVLGILLEAKESRILRVDSAPFWPLAISLSCHNPTMFYSKYLLSRLTAPTTTMSWFVSVRPLLQIKPEAMRCYKSEATTPGSLPGGCNIGHKPLPPNVSRSDAVKTKKYMKSLSELVSVIFSRLCHAYLFQCSCLHPFLVLIIHLILNHSMILKGDKT